MKDKLLRVCLFTAAIGVLGTLMCGQKPVEEVEVHILSPWDEDTYWLLLLFVRENEEEGSGSSLRAAR